ASVGRRGGGGRARGPLGSPRWSPARSCRPPPPRLEAGIMPEVRSRGGLCPASENAVRAPPPTDCLHAVLCSVRSLLLRRGGEPARPGGFDQRSRHDVVQATR